MDIQSFYEKYEYITCPRCLGERLIFGERCSECHAEGKIIISKFANIDDDNWIYHVEIIKTYSKDGELLRCISSVIPGEFEPDEATKKYWSWLDAKQKDK